MEIMVTVSILGIVLAIAMPSYENVIAGFELSATAREIVSDIRYAQHLSRDLLRQGLEQDIDNYNIYFNTVDDSYYVYKNLGEKIKEYRFPKSVDLYETNFDKERVVVKMNGLINPGGTITIRSRKTGKLLYVVVASISGRVRISRDFPVAGSD